MKTVMKLKNNKSTTFIGRGGRESMLLQHYKIIPHISAAASVVIENAGSEVIPHLTIARIWHSDFRFFAHLKKHLTGSHFTHNKQVQADTGKLFQGQSEEFYSDGFAKFIERITSKEW